MKLRNNLIAESSSSSVWQSAWACWYSLGWPTLWRRTSRTRCSTRCPRPCTGQLLPWPAQVKSSSLLWETLRLLISQEISRKIINFSPSWSQLWSCESVDIQQGPYFILVIITGTKLRQFHPEIILFTIIEENSLIRTEALNIYF